MCCSWNVEFLITAHRQCPTLIFGYMVSVKQPAPLALTSAVSSVFGQIWLQVLGNWDLSYPNYLLQRKFRAHLDITYLRHLRRRMNHGVAVAFDVRQHVLAKSSTAVILLLPLLTVPSLFSILASSLVALHFLHNWIPNRRPINASRHQIARMPDCVHTSQRLAAT
jgi:hypothetical protein